MSDYELLSPEKIGRLKDVLEAEKMQFIDMAPAEFVNLIFDRITALTETDILDMALKKGDVLPDFCLPDTDGNLINSAYLRERGPLVVTFFRGSWCPYCNATLRMVRKYYPHFKARGASLVAISPQTMEVSAELVDEAGLNFPVLSDRCNQYAQLCNLAFILDAVLKPYLEDFGVDFRRIYGNESLVLPVIATYVVQADGRITYSFLETDWTKRAEPLDVLHALPDLKQPRRLSLSDSIEFELAKIRDKHTDREMKMLFDGFDRLKDAGVEALALKTGDRAPDFKLLDKDGKVVDSRRLRKRGSLIVTFYHGSESPLCVLTIEALQMYLAKFKAKGASLVAITHKRCRDLHQEVCFNGAQFPVLSDVDSKVAKGFRIFHETHDYLSDDWDKMRRLPMTATYVIDSTGRIVYSYVNADHTQRAEPDDILQAIPKRKFIYNLIYGPFSVGLRKRLPPMYVSDASV